MGCAISGPGQKIPGHASLETFAMIYTNLMFLCVPWWFSFRDWVPPCCILSWPFTHYVGRARLELTTLQYQPPQCWDCRHLLSWLPLYGTDNYLPEKLSMFVWYIYILPPWNSVLKEDNNFISNWREIGDPNAPDGSVCWQLAIFHLHLFCHC